MIMAWIDEVNNLVKWIESAPFNEKRSVGARLVAIQATGRAFYAETQPEHEPGISNVGFLELNSKTISGKVKRYETKDRWDFFDTPEGNFADGFDNLPFDPTKLEDILVSIDITSGVIKVGGTSFFSA